MSQRLEELYTEISHLRQTVAEMDKHLQEKDAIIHKQVIMMAAKDEEIAELRERLEE